MPAASAEPTTLEEVGVKPASAATVPMLDEAPAPRPDTVTV